MIFNKNILPNLNLNQLYLILSSIYFDIERTENKPFILQQLKLAEWVEEEINLRKQIS